MRPGVEKRGGQEYVWQKEIGNGTFGTVSVYIRRRDNRAFAIKSVFVNEIDKDRIEEQAQFMLALRHQHIVELYDHFYKRAQKQFMLMMPFYPRGNLKSLSQSTSQRMSPNSLLLFTYQMASALALMQERTVCHCDLKPENILIEAPGQYLICDLGCARSLISNATRLSYLCVSSTGVKGVGTADYNSPQLFLQQHASMNGDMFSLGVILYKLIYSRHPLASSLRPYIEVMKEFDNGKLKISYPHRDHYGPIIDMVKQMLLPSNRKQQRIKPHDLVTKINHLLFSPGPTLTVTLVVNPQKLLSFCSHIHILLSALLNQLDSNSRLCQNNNEKDPKKEKPSQRTSASLISNREISTKSNLIENPINKELLELLVCTVMIELAEEVVKLFSRPYDEQSFYLFDQIVENIKKEYIEEAKSLLIDAKAFAMSRNVHQKIFCGKQSLSNRQKLTKQAQKALQTAINYRSDAILEQHQIFVQTFQLIVKTSLQFQYRQHISDFINFLLAY